jgi:HEPN/RES N-terminal domain 1/RES domain
MKDMMIEAQERGWWPLGGYVCAKCADEEFLAGYVGEHVVSGRCDFCGRSESTPIAADADEVMQLIGEGLYREWTHPVQVMGRVDGEWVGLTYDFNDVLWEVGVDDPTTPFWEEVKSHFEDEEWCSADPYGLEPHEILSYGWERFADHVKHHTRYVFLLESPDKDEYNREEIHPGLMLERLGEVIRATNIIVRVPSGARYVRMRAHGARVTLETARDLGPPPRVRAIRANRMSPAGIPMFYGAGDADTAIAEMGHADQPVGTHGEFVTLQELRLVDLSRAPQVPSLFDPLNASHRADFLFIRSFASAISQPIEADEREHIDYVPTQVVTDYVRRILRDDDGSPIDGILYRSSRRPGGECCVLFVESDQIVELSQNAAGNAVLGLDGSTLTTVSLDIKNAAPQARHLSNGIVSGEQPAES